MESPCKHNYTCGNECMDCGQKNVFTIPKSLGNNALFRKLFADLIRATVKPRPSGRGYKVA